MEKHKKQSKKDRIYLKMAIVFSESSYCQRNKVGSLLVKNNQIISDGYNGNISGFPNVCEDENNETLSTVLHAEANAILKCARLGNSCEGATLYTTLSPCLACSKLIIQSGIKRVVYNKDYRDKEGIKLLIEAGISVEKFKINYND
jgi:dCMP deaminase